MRHFRYRLIVGLAMLASVPTCAFSQFGSRVSVVFGATVDSNQPGSGQFMGSVKNAVTIGNVQVPAGSNAVAKLVQNTSGTTHSWNISLISIAAGGQNIAVTSASAVLGMGAAKAAVSNGLQGMMNGGGLPWGKKNSQQQQQQQQQQSNNKTPVKPSTSGARVYLPAGSEVMFLLGQNNQQQQTAQGTQAVQGGQAPAAQATQPVNVAQTLQTGQTANPAGLQTASGSIAGQDANQRTMTATSASVVYENISYQLQGCQKQAPHIICTMQITNQRAVDAFLNGGQGSYYVDQAGNKVGVTNRKIANCIGFGQCQLLSGVAMSASFEFVDEAGQAATLRRLLIAQSGKAVAEFDNVPVQ